jgi:ABC-type sugar transport system ATPase subunit
MKGISKTIFGVPALRNVNFDVNLGEVHVIAGANGAGKSTLMKIMTGVVRADPGHGEISVDGVSVQISDPVHARNLGISIIYQELSVVDNLTVAENIFLAREPVNAIGLVARAQMNQMAQKVLDSLHLKLQPSAAVGSLSIGYKQMIEIGKAISTNAKIIIMDEPTASLSHQETVTLIEIIAKLKAQGLGIIYISHRLEEVLQIADRVTVLRDGQTVDTMPIKDVSREILVSKMVNRSAEELYGQFVSHIREEVVLSIKHLAMRRPNPHGVTVSDVSFDLRRGEILGFFGLIGAGRTEIMEMLFGVRPHSGQIIVGGREVVIRSPVDAMRHGIGFVTEDRKGQGLVLTRSIRENFSLTHLKDYSQFLGGIVDNKNEARTCGEFIRSLGVKAYSIDQQVAGLSGGNQQKVVIAKWLATKPQILIVDEPTRGIDVGAKAEVHALLGKLAADGFSVIVISSDLPEVLAISDRIIVVRDGRIVDEVLQQDASQDRVMREAVG